MSEFENIPEKIEEMAQEEIVQAEEAAEAIEEAVEEAVETPAEVAEEIKADVEAEVSMGETVEVVSEAAEEIVSPAEPVVPELDPAADAAMNFMRETDEFATDYLKETMPGVVVDAPPVEEPIGSKPFAQENFAPEPVAQSEPAPAVPVPPVEAQPETAWQPVPPVQPAPQPAPQPVPAAPVPPVQPAPQPMPQSAPQAMTPQQQFQQYQQQQGQRAAQMNQQFQQYQQRQGIPVPPEYQSHPYTSQEGQVGGFATGYTGGADTAWQSQPNNIDAQPNPSFAQQMGPQNPSETQNSPYSQAGGFSTGYVPGQPTSAEGRGSFGDFANASQPASPYGQPNYNYQQPYPAKSSSEDPGYTMSLISMICGIVSCAMFWMHIGGIFALLSGVAAIILGIMSGKKSLTGKRNGMATTGLICGIIGISLTVIALACWACACSYLAGGLGGMY
jgi:hypothetical protein